MLFLLGSRNLNLLFSKSRIIQLDKIHYCHNHNSTQKLGLTRKWLYTTTTNHHISYFCRRLLLEQGMTVSEKSVFLCVRYFLGLWLVKRRNVTSLTRSLRSTKSQKHSEKCLPGQMPHGQLLCNIYKGNQLQCQHSCSCQLLKGKCNSCNQNPAT